MNIVRCMYKPCIIESKEMEKLMELIKVEKFKHHDFYFFENVYGIQTDKGYAKLIDIPIECYRQIIYDNTEIEESQNSHCFKSRQEAEYKKSLLCVLLINRYGTVDKVTEALYKLRAGEL